MIIVGCTSKPEAGDAKEFKNFFQKFLYVPAPDYASRLMLWHHFIQEQLKQVRSRSRSTGGKNKIVAESNTRIPRVTRFILCSRLTTFDFLSARRPK